MIWRALAVWIAILVLANVNGALRELWLIPHMGAVPGRTLSTLLLSGLVFLLTWLTIGWIHPSTRSEALAIGAFWLVLTLAFEFLAGHYIFRKPWADLLVDYDITRGRIWILVLVVVLLAPLWTGRLKGLLGPSHVTSPAD
jgi:hypothetical protein